MIFKVTVLVPRGNYISNNYVVYWYLTTQLVVLNCSVSTIIYKPEFSAMFFLQNCDMFSISIICHVFGKKYSYLRLVIVDI